MESTTKKLNDVSPSEWDRVSKRWDTESKITDLAKEEYMKAIKTKLQDDGDMVNNPKHYTQGSIQPIEYILANDLGYLEGNIIKYVTRYKYKNGQQDLKKAQWYLSKLMSEYDE